MKRNELARLAELAGVLLDHRLAGLRQAAEAKAQTERALEGLAAAAKPQPDGLEGAAAALATLAYGRWADVRRAEINLVLARQTHQWLQAREAAQEAFGKSEALKKLGEKLAKR
jgi:hypothetical protein